MKIHYTFKNQQLLQQALTHKSQGKINNERLEFLGDAVLDGVIAYYLFCQYPEASEGQLSRMKANLIQKSTLATIARELNIQPHIICQNEDISQQAATLADVLEAIIGAIFIDSDIDTCTHYIKLWFKPNIEQSDDHLAKKDDKTKLQEYCQHQRIALPDYKVTRIVGPEHQQHFYVKCQIEHEGNHSEGSGTTIRSAEQDAAKKLLAMINKEP